VLQRINVSFPSPQRGVFFGWCRIAHDALRCAGLIFRQAALPAEELFALTHAKSVRMREQRHQQGLNEVHSASVWSAPGAHEGSA
jgi:hypothetical protein